LRILPDLKDLPKILENEDLSRIINKLFEGSWKDPRSLKVLEDL